MEAENQIVYLDTHVVVWLYEGRLELIPEDVQLVLERAELLISPLVTLELQYLHEIKKITVAGPTIVNDLVGRIELAVCDQPFASIIDQAVRESWTRDPFDRMLVAHARLRDLPLLTKDKSIRSHYKRAFWKV